MVNQDMIYSHLSRMGLGDAVISTFDVDDSGDYVKGYLPDLSLEDIKSKFLQVKYYNKFISDFTTEFYSFGINETIDGYNVYYKLTISRETFGSSVSILVKRIDYYDSFGKYVPVLGFEMLGSIKTQDEEDYDRFKVSGTI